MSLSSRSKNKIVDKINTAFNDIGYANGMRMPKSENNAEPVAWELFVAQHLAATANKRKELAERSAALAGVINNKETNPKPAGTAEVVYSGNVVSVSLNVSQPAVRIDASKMADYLKTKGVAPNLISAALSHATGMTKPAHVFKAMLITDNNC